MQGIKLQGQGNQTTSYSRRYTRANYPAKAGGAHIGDYDPSAPASIYPPAGPSRPTNSTSRGIRGDVSSENIVEGPRVRKKSAKIANNFVAVRRGAVTSSNRTGVFEEECGWLINRQFGGGSYEQSPRPRTR